MFSFRILTTIKFLSIRLGYQKVLKFKTGSKLKINNIKQLVVFLQTNWTINTQFKTIKTTYLLFECNIKSVYIRRKILNKTNKMLIKMVLNKNVNIKNYR